MARLKLNGGAGAHFLNFPARDYAEGMQEVERMPVADFLKTLIASGSLETLKSSR